MGQASHVLDYAVPPARRSATWWVNPANAVWAGLAAAGVAFVAGPTVGSGIIRVNPVALCACAVTVACAIAYALLRLWRDRAEGIVRAVVFATALVTAVAAFANAQASVWGYGWLPRMSLRHEYWQSMAVFALAILGACAFSAVTKLVTWATGRAAVVDQASTSIP
jgi:drug/metabolite transporter (DMT)-like permease